MVIGDDKKFVSALIIPAVDSLLLWCHHNGITETNLNSLIINEQVIARYQRTIDTTNTDVGHVEQIKKFTILPVAWEPIKADGSESELTPTLKLKRRVILQKFSDAIERMYL
jgi:long-chain acyl-CoA synthetase